MNTRNTRGFCAEFFGEFLSFEEVFHIADTLKETLLSQFFSKGVGRVNEKLRSFVVFLVNWKDSRRKKGFIFKGYKFK